MSYFRRMLKERLSGVITTLLSRANHPWLIQQMGRVGFQDLGECALNRNDIVREIVS